MSRQSDTANYYMPYDSGDESDEYSDDDTMISDGEDIRIRREEDPRYAIIRAAGPKFDTVEKQLDYQERAPGAPYDSNTNISSLAGYLYLNPPKTVTTSLFSIKSSNRDKRVWPSPFRFTLKTPRVYKNVTKFQLVQLSFPYNTNNLSGIGSIDSTITAYLSTIGYDSTCISRCLNALTESGNDFTSFGISEFGRVNSKGEQILTKLQIPNGDYSNDALAAELNFQSNNTPPFNLITYDYFQQYFKVTRDISILFNEPGDNFYSRINSNRFGRHTKETIMNTYYTQHEIDRFSEITDIIAFNAYYYPVLKELSITPNGSYFINTDGLGLTKEEAMTIITNSFQGLDSMFYYLVCSTNRDTLDSYRKNHTFEHRNINRYCWSFDKNNNRFKVDHDTLHTSIRNDITNSFNQFLSQELSLNSLTSNSFNNIKKECAQLNTIYDHLKTNLSTTISNYFLDGTTYQYCGGDCHSSISSSVTFSRSLDALHSDTDFSCLFNYRSTFGRQFNLHTGKIFTFTNFIDYHSTLSSYYMQVQSTSASISSLYNTVYNRHHSYVSTKYSGVLPQYMIDNKTYTTGKSLPVSFLGKRLSYISGESIISNNLEEDQCVSTCVQLIQQTIKSYYSCLPVETVTNTIGYRLGLPGSIPDTYNNLSTFFKQLSTTSWDFLLRINEEQNFNGMDVAMNENYSVTQQPTGEIRLFCAKILAAGTAGDGSVTQTCVQNPILFENYLGKLDRLSFSIFADDDYLTPMWRLAPFPLQYQEWTATFQIDEQIAFADRDTGFGAYPSIPIPTNPDLMPYLALSKPGNPNNKER